MRLILIILLALTLSISCKEEKNSMKDDVKELVELEKQIVDLTVKHKTTENPELNQKVDSLTTILQKRSIELQVKYKKLNHTKDFQEAYQEVKKEVFKK